MLSNNATMYAWHTDLLSFYKASMAGMEHSVSTVLTVTCGADILRRLY